MLKKTPKNKGNFQLINEVMSDKRLVPIAKILLFEIQKHCLKKGYCWATNKYLAANLNVSPDTISRRIADLERFGYIHTKITKVYRDEYGNIKGNRREIYLGDAISTDADSPRSIGVHTPYPHSSSTLTAEDGIPFPQTEEEAIPTNDAQKNKNEGTELKEEKNKEEDIELEGGPQEITEKITEQDSFSETTLLDSSDSPKMRLNQNLNSESIELLARHLDPSQKISDLTRRQQAEVLLWFGASLRGQRIIDLEHWVQRFEQALEHYDAPHWIFGDYVEAMWRNEHNSWIQGNKRKKIKGWHWNLGYITRKPEKGVEGPLEKSLERTIDIEPTENAIELLGRVKHLLPPKFPCGP